MRLLFIIPIITILFSCTPEGKKEPQYPNIIFILADDMGYGDPKCFNPDSKIETPNIDRLAAEGMRFVNAHSPGSWCTPSRYGLLTGLYPFRADLNRMKAHSLIDDDQLTIGKVLQAKGYETACVGKWHLGFEEVESLDYSKPIVDGPIDRGFDYFFGMYTSLDIPPYFYIENDSVLAAPTDSVERKNTEGWTSVQGEFWRKGGIAPGLKHADVLPTFTEKALGFIKRHHEKAPQQPFFLYFPLPAPHTPWLPDENFAGTSAAGLYGDFASMTDYQIGRILNLLDSLELTGNTLVMFSSDNGPVWFEQDKKKYGHLSMAHFRGQKMDSWEGSNHMPFIVRWPGTVAGQSVSEETICFTDMLATFSALVGDTLDDRYAKDSYNLLPVLKGQPYESPLREATVIMSNVIHQGDWKLILGNGYGGLSRFNQYDEVLPDHGDSLGLYNLKDDPSEYHNVAEAHPEIVERMKALLEAYKAR